MHEYIHSQLRAKVVPFDCAHFARIVTRDTIIAGEFRAIKKERERKKEREDPFTYCIPKRT